ncbi:MAG: hypothetical protein Terrestrivirus2_239 [Terrestrivirus sp.]|uniref:Uncharacterized protein n=1 Tax=Terrestrivirus sp. TaxID=2487775 RepID=A0A3G4ZP44_9VIRU|nr:MAG: hypothetical protein Terrestrivirus2_239 [Terrestrivirus sp.]
MNLFKSTSTIDIQEKRKTVTIDVAKEVFNVTGPNQKKCKIEVDCDNMKILIDAIKEFIKKTEGDYKTSVTKIIDSVKSSSQSINTAEDLATFLNDCEKSRKLISEKQRIRDNANNTGGIIIQEIDCMVNIKDKDPVKGKISKIRIFTDLSTNIKELVGVTKKGQNVRTCVDIIYPDPNTNKNETIKDIDLDKLCLADTHCDIGQTGGQMRGGNVNNEDKTSDSEKAIMICE